MAHTASGCGFPDAGYEGKRLWQEEELKRNQTPDTAERGGVHWPRNGKELSPPARLFAASACFKPRLLATNGASTGASVHQHVIQSQHTIAVPSECTVDRPYLPACVLLLHTRPSAVCWPREQWRLQGRCASDPPVARPTFSYPAGSEARSRRTRPTLCTYVPALATAVPALCNSPREQGGKHRTAQLNNLWRLTIHNGSTQNGI